MNHANPSPHPAHDHGHDHGSHAQGAAAPAASACSPTQSASACCGCSSDPHGHGALPGWPRIAAALLFAAGAEAAHWAQYDVPGMLLAVAAIALAGLGVYRAGLKDLARLRLGIHALMAVAVTGAMKYEDRLPIYEDYRSGAARALVTVQVLTEGADFPMCDTVVLARPTRSRNLYSQMVGRALRLYPNKDDALVLDLAGSTRAMKLVNLTALDTGAETREVDENGDELELAPLDDALPGDGADLDLKVVRQGPVDMVSIDLLAGSDLVWMETVGGVPFLPLMQDNQVVFVWPEDGIMPPRGQAETVKWAIGQMGTRSRRGGWVTAGGRYPTDEPDYTDLATALKNAEVWIVESDQQLPERKASWRRNQKPSEAQLKFARTLGIVIDEDMTKARLSDEISVRVTSRALDKFLEA